MAKRTAKAHPISPSHPPEISLSEPPLVVPDIMSLPGTTDTQPYRGLGGKARTRLRHLLAVQTTAADRLGPLGRAMADFEEIADEVIGEISITTGRCGPTAQILAVLGAKFTLIANHCLSVADPTTKQGCTYLNIGRACADTARLAFGDAMKTSMLAAELNPPSRVNPTDAFVGELEELPE